MCYKCFIIKIIFVFIGEKDFLFFLIVLVVCNGDKNDVCYI